MGGGGSALAVPEAGGKVLDLTWPRPQKAGETVSFRPRGNSMVGKVESGQLCTVAPIDDHAALRVGAIVLCRVGGNEYLHLVKAIQGPRFQIGNNRGRINGWVTANGIFGLCVKVED